MTIPSDLTPMPNDSFKMTPSEDSFLPLQHEGLLPEAGKPLACSSPIREYVKGREVRVHDGFHKSINRSTYPEHQPIPSTIHNAFKK